MFLLSRFGVAYAWIPLACLSVACGPGVAAGGEVLSGPYSAVVERVVDGDTLAVRVRIWVGQDVGVLVRLRGIDAPELRGRCDSETRRAGEAAMALGRLVAEVTVRLSQVEGDKYFGRVVADVTTASGEDVADMLLADGFARAYDGGARAQWCGSAGADGPDAAGLAQR